MLCDKCCSHVHKLLSLLEGKCVNLLAYGCDGGDCDQELRKRFDEYYGKWVQKKRDERNLKRLEEINQ
ncbi:MAG: hypothetical protein ACH349_01550 [Candidatus Rhabdochlamydia sp.]